jgi:tetratricopeptide (TPR) repeat protein
MGDQPGAEEVFQQAHELGRDPVPGLALLLLDRGNDRAAASMIGARPGRDRPGSRRAGEADVAAGELAEVADVYGTPALHASAALTRASVLVAQGDPAAALDEADRARRIWQELDLPYELARTRMLIGAAQQELGDQAAAALEITTAKAVFERLGAIPDAKRAASLLEAERVEPARAERVHVHRHLPFDQSPRGDRRRELAQPRAMA